MVDKARTMSYKYNERQEIKSVRKSLNEWINTIPLIKNELGKHHMSQRLLYTKSQNVPDHVTRTSREILGNALDALKQVLSGKCILRPGGVHHEKMPTCTNTEWVLLGGIFFLCIAGHLGNNYSVWGLVNRFHKFTVAG